jgi:hypothetical protein
MTGDVLLVDGFTNQDVLLVGTQSNARLILTTQRRRANRAGSKGWQLVGRERISHHFVGGITERIVDLSIYQPPGATSLTLGPPIHNKKYHEMLVPS